MLMDKDESIGCCRRVFLNAFDGEDLCHPTGRSIGVISTLRTTIGTRNPDNPPGTFQLLEPRIAKVAK